MITPAEINLRYKLELPHLADLRKRVQEALLAYCDENQLALVSRVKTLSSLSEKIESGRYQRWSEIEDMVALAVVVPTLADEDPVLDFLGAKFELLRLKKRGATRKAPDVFRFDSTRFVGRLAVPASAPRGGYDGGRCFEIQIRTAFDHAWMVTTHALAYKTGSVDWRHQRLAAELKATAEKMDLLVLAFQRASALVPESPWPVIEAKRDILGFYRGAASEGLIPEVLLPKDWSRFADNVYDIGKRCMKGRDPDVIAKAVTETVRKALSRLGRDGVPLSLSLWQFTFACLFDEGALAVPKNGYWPLITTEMESLYPGMREVGPRFELT